MEPHAKCHRITVDPLPSMKWMGFPGGSDGDESACNSGDPNSISELGRYPDQRREWLSTLQYSCLENSMNKGAWRATVHSVTESQTGLSD